MGSETIRLLIYLTMIAIFVALNAAYLVWVERKGAGRFQRRPGPTEVGWAGLLQPIADGIKLLSKQLIVPPGADAAMFRSAPLVVLAPAMMCLAVIPFSDTLCFGTTAQGGLDVRQLMTSVPRGEACSGAGISVQVVDLNVGILYFFAVAGTGIVGAALAGWASDNKYSLLGGLRAAGQMVSYEVTLGLTLIGAMMIYGALTR